MMNFDTYFLLEGGAGGHMAHPFELPNVRTGKDLINFFNKAYTVASKGNVSLKIDGINVSIKLVTQDGVTQFALDRGSMKPLDVAGITIDKLKERFGEGHGMVAAGEKTLTIMNAAIPQIEPELRKLGFYSDPSLFFNTEYVQGQTNVLAYDHDFLAIHGVNKFVQVTPRRREGVETVYDVKALMSLVDKVNKIASQYNFKVYGDVPVKVVGAPNYGQALKSSFTVTIDGEKVTDTLQAFLNKAKNPGAKRIALKDGRIVGAMSKEVYTTLLNGTPLENFVADPKDYQAAIDGAVIYHATRVLGDALLKVASSDMGSADKHEGLVLRNKTLSPNPVKVTGSFIITGMQSKFRKEENDEDIDNPYSRLKFQYPPYGNEGRMLTPRPSTFSEMASMAIGRVRPETKRVVVVYPGRFQPFHKGHAEVYNKLKGQFPQADVYITTSDKTDPTTSPFNFEEKLNMILASGADPKMVVKAAQPYLAPELVAKFDKENTILIFAVGAKDMQGPDARFKFGLRRDGKPLYFQKFESIDKSEPLSKHAYVTIAPTVTFDINGQSATSASEIRERYRNADDKTRRNIITGLYGTFKPEIFKLFNQKLG